MTSHITPTSAAEVIGRRLHQAGARHAFGIPGGEVLALMDALEQAGVAVTLVKHENCAGFMGEGAWHGGGGLAVLFATIGPGIANAANTIANAWQDRVPMIVLTGCVPALESHTYTHQVFDHVAMLSPITKAAFRVEAGTAGVVVDKAVAIATSGRPGPVVLDVPIDVQRESRLHWHAPAHRPPGATAPHGLALVTAREWLAEAHRPLVIAGLDAVVQEAAPAVADFCATHSAPLITTYKAKGILDERDPLALGAAGLSPLCDAELLPLVHDSDCVLLAGYDPIEMRIGWRDPFREDQRVIDISAEANTHYMHQGTLNLVADVAASLQAIGEAPPHPDRWPEGQPAAVRERLRESLRGDEEWGPAAVVDAARRACPQDTVATVDSGAHRILLSQLWTCPAPRTLLQSSALCTMGCAVPLAMGRKIAERDRPVIAFVGDAGVEMFLGELATARDLELALPVVVFVDRQLALIELKQRGQQMPNLGVDFPGTDLAGVATALGGHGIVVRDRNALGNAISEAFERNTFTLICAEIGRNAYDGRL
jgi:acetolactate synthase-1/2/3 large subunit